MIVGAGFYVLVTAAVAYVAPWQGLLGKPFATAVAFEQGTGAPWLVRIVMASAMLALFECFNGNFVASSRLLFAFGRRGTIYQRFRQSSRQISDSFCCRYRHRMAPLLPACCWVTPFSCRSRKWAPWRRRADGLWRVYRFGWSKRA